MKQPLINSSGKHPETLVQPGMTAGPGAGEIPSPNPDTHHVFSGNQDPFVQDLCDMELVEYSERPYLTDEQMFI